MNEMVSNYLNQRQKEKLINPNPIRRNRVANIIREVKLKEKEYNEHVKKIKLRGSNKHAERRRQINYKIFKLIYNQDRTMSEIAKEFNVTRRVVNNWVINMKSDLKPPYKLVKDFLYYRIEKVE